MANFTHTRLSGWQREEKEIRVNRRDDTFKKLPASNTENENGIVHFTDGEKKFTELVETVFLDWSGFPAMDKFRFN